MKTNSMWRKPILTGAAFLAVSVLAVFGSWAMGAASVERDVPYVPTPMDVVNRMLDMVQVGPQDVVYDLGCGDGRIVITAVKERGAKRGVGIDIDPQRIQESNANAQAEGITDRVEFIEGDLFAADISDATVVTLYLLPTVNIRLRPKLLNELAPGTRVVSHAFDMKQWEPDQEDNVAGREVFFWIIPANMTGTWRWTTADGSANEMVVEQEFQKFMGSVSDGGPETPVVDPVVQGAQVEFSVQQQVNGAAETVRYQGTVDGDTIQGQAVRANGQSEPWKATRQQGTKRPLEGNGEVA
jgi:precorrin-6B methylase 2